MNGKKRVSPKQIEDSMFLEGEDPEDDILGLNPVIGEELKPDLEKNKGEFEFDSVFQSQDSSLDSSIFRLQNEYFVPSASEFHHENSRTNRFARQDFFEETEFNVGLESIIGSDERIHVPDTLNPDWPWSRQICSLIIKAKNGQQLRGTGWMASSRLVMTVGHNVFIHRRKLGWAASVTVIPGRNGRRAPFSHFTVPASSLFTTPLWKENGDISADLGGIIVPHQYAKRFSKRIGHFSISALDDERLRSHKANIVGYPTDKTPGTQWWHGKRLSAEIGSRTIRYTIDTEDGNSGSCVFIKHGNQRTVIGVHNADFGIANQGVRITENVVRMIKRWRELAAKEH